MGMYLGILVGASFIVAVMVTPSDADGDVKRTVFFNTWGWLTFAGIVIPLLWMWAARYNRKEIERVRAIDLAEARKKREAEQAIMAQKQAEEDLRHARQAAIDATHRLPQEALTRYKYATHLLTVVEWHVRDAKGHRRARAFTPFWESIEAALQRLGEHRAEMDQIPPLHTNWANAASHLLEIAPDRLTEAGAFPTELTESAKLVVGVTLAREVQSLVYEAQSDFQFASIYEQRRTTTAVIAGFAGLNAAVIGMGGAIRASYDSLAGSIERQTIDVRQGLSGLGAQLDVDAYTSTIGREIREVNNYLREIAGRH